LAQTDRTFQPANQAFSIGIVCFTLKIGSHTPRSLSTIVCYSYGSKPMNSMKDSFANIITQVGEDLTRPGLVDTPQRAAKAMEFLTRGYRLNIDEVINGALFPTTSNEMVIVKNIELYSMCEHHMLPFIGKCHVAYLPSDVVIGLSKIARIVDMFARRLQIQEHLTQQIAETIMEKTRARGVGVIIEAKHMCMMMRGVEKQNSVMTTSCMLGAFRNSQSTRNEFLSLISK
jgi:GTP cyclohydrolase I